MITSKQKGQGLVEFALILPLLLLMVFGIIEFGRMFQAYLTLQHAAREAARYAVTGQPGGTEVERVHAIKEKALESMAGVNVDYSKIDWRECGCGTEPGCLYPTCDTMDAQHWKYESPGDPNNVNALLLQVYGPNGENDPGNPGERVIVRVIYNFQTLTPFFSGVFPIVQLRGQMEMINEGFGVTGASHGGVLPPPLAPLPEMGPYPSITLFTDDAGVEVDQYNLGMDLIYVTVVDKDENFHLDQRDTVKVIVRSPTGDIQTLTLWEIGPNAGVFRSETGLPSTSGTPTSENGKLETGAGHTITVEYKDDDDPSDTSSDRARMMGAGASETNFTDSGGGEVPDYVIGVDGIYVTVKDSDEAGPVTVTVFSPTGDSVELTLARVAAGVFRNATPLPSTSDPGADNESTLYTRAGNTVTVEYEDDDDSGDTSSDTAIMLSSATPSITRFTHGGGVDVNEYAIGIDGIYVTVDDTDENTDSLTRQEFSVTVIDSLTGDRETLTLFETGVNTGIFQNDTPLFSGPNPTGIRDNGLLETQAGNIIIARYTDDDSNPTDTSSDQATMVAQATDSSTFFTDDGGTNVSIYNIGVDYIFVTVQDGDENLSSGVEDTVSVTITDGETGDSVMLELTETGSNTGVFRNITGLESITGTVSADDVLQTRPGSTITASYEDDDEPLLDTSSDTATMGFQSITRFTDGGGVDADQYGVGSDSIYVTVEDADENADSGSAEEVTVTITDGDTGDSVTLTLTETGSNTGVFRNITGLQSISGTVSADDVLQTQPGSTITARYVDQDGAEDTTSDTAIMIVRTPSATTFTDNLGVEQVEYYLGTQLIYVTVEDADENLYSNVVETVSVTVTDGETGDSETLTLSETGADTGVFRGGGLASNQGLEGNPNNNLLETQVGNRITASYTDDDDGTDTSQATATMLESDQPPDLVVTDITVGDPNPVVGVPVSITVTVRNQNQGSVTSTLFDVDFYIYTDLSSQPVPGRPGDAKQWYTENVEGGTEIQLVYSIAFPQEGTLYLYAQVDTTNRVAEADETNNIYLLELPYVTVDVGCNVLFTDYMEDGAGLWTTGVGPGSVEFARVSGVSHSGIWAWWVDDVPSQLQSYLISPPITVPPGLGNVQLRFWYSLITEEDYDGGWLDYRIDTGGWNAVPLDMFDANGYDGDTADTCPSGTHEAWVFNIDWRVDWQEVVATIPIADGTGEHTIQFRWHFECDAEFEAPAEPDGWWIDDVTVSTCQQPPPPPPPGTDVCVTAFQDSFSGTLSQWSVSNPSYVGINNGRLRLRTQGGGTTSEEVATTVSMDLSGREWAILSYSWWTNALDGTGEWGRVRVSDDGGSTWKMVTTYLGAGYGNASITLPGTYGVSLSDNFMIEFSVRADQWQDGNQEYFEVDNVVVESCDTEPIPPQDPNTGNIGGTTLYYDEDYGQYFYVSGVDVWATQVNPAGDTYHTYSLDDYNYGFWNLPSGSYNIYAESIINNVLYNDLITGVLVRDDGTTTTRHILLEMVY
jgi:hypothetical protein